MPWGSVADWLMAVAAVVASIFAWLSWTKADRANTLAHDANDTARDSNTIARQSQAAASEANRIATDAADAAKRSADAAEKANERAMLREEEFHEVKWTVRWNPTPAERPDGWLPHLLVSNNGPDVAFEVKVLFRVGETWAGMVRLGDISPGDAQAFFPNENGFKLVSPASEYEGVLPPPDKPAPPRDLRPFPSHEWNLDEDPHELFTRMREEELEAVVRWHSAMGRPRQRTYTFYPHGTLDPLLCLDFHEPSAKSDDLPV